MKKRLLVLVVCIVSALAGCGQIQEGDMQRDTEEMSPAQSGIMPESGGQGETDRMADEACTDGATVVPEEKEVALTGEVQELEKGLSSVQYEGDYGFDDFLSGGGAASDQEVLDFLTETLLSEADADGLVFGSGMFGCSTISVKSSGEGYLFGRNFDWMACDAMIVAAYPENGYSSISTVNMDFVRSGAGAMSAFLPDDVLTLAALYAPLDGMNEAGLCIAVNMIQDDLTIEQNTEKPDITTTTAVRLVLDRASTVEEALELLSQYDLHASMGYMVHFAIADAQGNRVAVEYIDHEMSVVETPVLTNFYISEGEKQGIGTAQSHTRFETLEDILEQTSEMDVLQVRAALDSVSKDNYGSHESTEWSIIFDQRALVAHYYHRENYKNGYVVALK